MNLRTCVSKSGFFVYGIHKPQYKVTNYRKNDFLGSLGSIDGKVHMNSVNFPEGDVEELSADFIFEIPNPFPFRGTTYISKSWAEAKAENPSAIILKSKKGKGSSLFKWLKDNKIEPTKEMIKTLPKQVLYTQAMVSNDPKELVLIARISCEFEFDGDTPIGLKYEDKGRGARAVIKDHDLFEAVVNNINLPDIYKEVMVLRPGVQGGSEIVGEWDEEGSHIFEYLRRNSYIPWGHYAANMANDSVRYSIKDLSLRDMAGLRHLYFQRTVLRAAEELGIELPKKREILFDEELESIRLKILSEVKKGKKLKFNSTLWGWNFGFDFAATGYRLHASHQQIHQQFAMVPYSVTNYGKDGGEILPYSCGDQIYDFVCDYRKEYGKSFFENYINAIKTNERMDGRGTEKSLVVFEDENVILFVPKAQTSQWELQLMTLSNVGNILEADSSVRSSLAKGMLTAMKALTGAGAEMISTIEYSRRFDAENCDQHLLYSFMPKLPQSMGAFSEAQLRWINGHYPEDFAFILRKQLKSGVSDE